MVKLLRYTLNKDEPKFYYIDGNEKNTDGEEVDFLVLIGNFYDKENNIVENVNNIRNDSYELRLESKMVSNKIINDDIEYVYGDEKDGSLKKIYPSNKSKNLPIPLDSDFYETINSGFKKNDISYSIEGDDKFKSVKKIKGKYISFFILDNKFLFNTLKIDKNTNKQEIPLKNIKINVKTKTKEYKNIHPNDNDIELNNLKNNPYQESIGFTKSPPTLNGIRWVKEYSSEKTQDPFKFDHTYLWKGFIVIKLDYKIVLEKVNNEFKLYLKDNSDNIIQEITGNLTLNNILNGIKDKKYIISNIAIKDFKRNDYLIEYSFDNLYNIKNNKLSSVRYENVGGENYNLSEFEYLIHYGNKDYSLSKVKRIDGIFKNKSYSDILLELLNKFEKIENKCKKITIKPHSASFFKDFFKNKYFLSSSLLSRLSDLFSIIEINNPFLKVNLSDSISNIKELILKNTNLYINGNALLEIEKLDFKGIGLYTGDNNKTGVLNIRTKASSKIMNLNIKEDIKFSIGSNLEENSELTIIGLNLDFESDLNENSQINIEHFRKAKIIDFSITKNIPNKEIVRFYNCLDTTIDNYCYSGNTRNKTSIIIDKCSKFKFLNSSCFASIDESNSLIKYLAVLNTDSSIILNNLNIKNVHNSIIDIQNSIFNLKFENIHSDLSIEKYFSLKNNNVKIKNISIDNCTFIIKSNYFNRINRINILNSTITLIKNDLELEVINNINIKNTRIDNYRKLIINLISNKATSNIENCFFNSEDNIILKYKKINDVIERNSSDLVFKNNTINSRSSFSIIDIDKMTFDKIILNCKEFIIGSHNISSGEIKSKHYSDSTIIIKNCNFNKIYLNTKHTSSFNVPYNLKFINSNGEFVTKDNLINSNNKGNCDIDLVNSNIAVFSESKDGIMYLVLKFDKDSTGCLLCKSENYQIGINGDIYKYIEFDEFKKELDKKEEKFNKNHIGKIYNKFIYGQLPNRL